MSHLLRQARLALLGALAAVTTFTAAFAQDGPVAAMFRADLEREQALASSFKPIEMPAVGSVPPLQLYLSAGDLERAFDKAEFRPDAAIVPTNTGLDVTAASPSTQRVLIQRVQKHPQVYADLQEQVDARRKRSTAGEVLQIGLDYLVAELPRNGSASGGAFPRLVCLLATDFPGGGAIDRRELFSQDRVRKGVTGCLTALDAAGARTVMMPLMGAASAETQKDDPVYEGQRLLKECRHLNSAAGIALGIRDFAPTRASVREIGIVQWDKEIAEMFKGGRIAQSAYRLYAEQFNQAVTKGLAGEKTTANDLNGSCAATFGG